MQIQRRVLKTQKMLVIEMKDSQNRPIEQIMLDAFRQYGSRRAAATAMKISPALFHQWQYRLNVEIPEKLEAVVNG